MADDTCPEARLDHPGSRRYSSRIERAFGAEIGGEKETGDCFLPPFFNNFPLPLLHSLSQSFLCLDINYFI